APRRTTEHVSPRAGGRRRALPAYPFWCAAARTVRRSTLVPEGSLGPGRGRAHARTAGVPIPPGGATPAGVRLARRSTAQPGQRLYTCFQPRDWAAVAADFERLCGDVPQR